MRTLRVLLVIQLLVVVGQFAPGVLGDTGRWPGPIDRALSIGFWLTAGAVIVVALRLAMDRERLEVPVAGVLTVVAAFVIAVDALVVQERIPALAYVSTGLLAAAAGVVLGGRWRRSKRADDGAVGGPRS